jgi:hypothetical protein
LKQHKNENINTYKSQWKKCFADRCQVLNIKIIKDDTADNWPDISRLLKGKRHKRNRASVSSAPPAITASSSSTVSVITRSSSSTLPSATTSSTSYFSVVKLMY